MSIYISNFSIDLEQEVDCSVGVILSVEVTDPTYGIATLGTYYIINGENIIPSFTTISDGYLLEYTLLPTENITLEVVVKNNNNDSFTKEFILYFGYKVLWSEVVHWRPDTQIPLTLSATNNVKAPRSSYFSTFFNTHRSREATLEATITAAGSGKADLTVSVTPQNKYLVFNREYTIKITGVKDFAGNVMEPMTFKFKTISG